MPAPVLNYTPQGPGWPGYRGYMPGGAYQGGGVAGMGDMLTMSQLAPQQPTPGGPGSFLSPHQMAYAPPIDPLTAYGMAGMGAPWDMAGMAGMGAVAPAPAPRRGALKFLLAMGLGGLLVYFLAPGRR